MIRAARSRHRVMVVTLTLIAPALFVAGLMLRQPIPVTEAEGPRDAASSGEGFELLGDAVLGEELPLRVSWLRSAGERRAVGLALEGPLKRPDLLVYGDDSGGGGAPSAIEPGQKLALVVPGSRAASSECAKERLRYPAIDIREGDR